MNLWSGLADIVTSIWNAIVAGATSLSSVFWTSAEGGGSLTIYGYLLATVLGIFVVSLTIGLFFRVFNYIKARKGGRRYRK